MCVAPHESRPTARARLLWLDRPVEARVRPWRAPHGPARRAAPSDAGEPGTRPVRGRPRRRVRSGGHGVCALGRGARPPPHVARSSSWPVVPRARRRNPRSEQLARQVLRRRQRRSAARHGPCPRPRPRPGYASLSIARTKGSAPKSAPSMAVACAPADCSGWATTAARRSTAAWNALPSAPPDPLSSLRSAAGADAANRSSSRPAHRCSRRARRRTRLMSPRVSCHCWRLMKALEKTSTTSSWRHPCTPSRRSRKSHIPSAV